MPTSSNRTHGEAIKALVPGAFTTIAQRLDRGGSLQARRLESGAVQFYWRYSHGGKTSREPIGPYDSLAPPKKLEPTSKGYSVSAALHRCADLAKQHGERANTGGLREAKSD